MRLVRIVFSPTGGARRALDCLAGAWDGCPATELDLSDAALDFSAVSLDAEDVCLAATPSFGGRVPAVAVERIRQIRANGAVAVPIVVYGNRAYDDTLLEWETALQAAGFHCAAAVTAVAEHSLVRSYGAGRPDEADGRELLGFGRTIRAALEAGERTGEVAAPGNHPYREYKGTPFHPAAGKGCDRCGVCATLCPVGAIPVGDPQKTDEKICITCMRCVAVCPQQARAVSRPALLAVAQMLKKPCEARKENELFLAKAAAEPLKTPADAPRS